MRLRMRREFGIGIGRNRMGDDGQQGNVVLRVAVKVAVIEAVAAVFPIAASQAMVWMTLPAPEVGMPISLPVISPLAVVSGSAAIRYPHAERGGNRGGHEAVGGGDDGNQIARILMPFHQIAAPPA